MNSPIFLGESNREWARQHRDDSPVLKGTPEYAEIQASIADCVDRAKSFLDIGSVGEEWHPSLLAIDNEYTKLLWQIAPIHWLPNEMLSKIFLDATEGDESFLPESKNLENITLTCSQWRDVAYETPHLWREISLPVSEWVYEDRLRCAQSWPSDETRVSKWLQRAKAATISLTTRSGRPDSPSLISRHIYPIIPHLKRCNSLSLGGAWIVGEISVALLKGECDSASLGSEHPRELQPLKFSALESISLSGISFIQNHSNHINSFFIGHGFDAPRLSTLTLDHVHIDAPTYETLVQYTPGIRSLNLDACWHGFSGYVGSHVSHENADCIALGWLNILEGRGVRPPPDEPSVVLPHLIRNSGALKTLSMKPNGGATFDFFASVVVALRSLAAPISSLRELRIVMAPGSDRFAQDHLDDLDNLNPFMIFFPRIRKLDLRCLGGTSRWPERWDLAAKSIVEKVFNAVTELDRLRSIKLRGIPFDVVAFTEAADSFTKSRVGNDQLELELVIAPLAVHGAELLRFERLRYRPVDAAECRQMVSSWASSNRTKVDVLYGDSSDEEDSDIVSYIAPKTGE